MSQTSATQPRPTQVTAAAWMIMVGSVFVVLMVWDRIAGLHTLDSQKALEGTLNSPGVRGAGLELSDLMAIVKTVSIIGAACATAMVILGYQTLRRSRSARLALSILAVPLFLCGLVTGGFVAAVVVAAVATLWLRPARLWFDGRPADADRPAPRSRTHPSRDGRDQASPPAHEQRHGTSTQYPGVYHGQYPPPHAPQPPPQESAPPTTQWTPSPPAGQQQWAAPAWTPPPTSAYGAWPDLQTRRGSRPPALTSACLLTWTLTALSLLVLVGSVVVLATDSGYVLDSMHRQNPDLGRQGITDHMILVLAYVMCGLFVLWGIGAAAASVVCFRGRRWGWYALLISSGALAAFSLVGVFASLVMLVPLAASGTVIALLVRPEVRAWMR